MPVSFRGEVSGLEESRCFHMDLEERCLDSHRGRGSGEGNKRVTAFLASRCSDERDNDSC